MDSEHKLDGNIRSIKEQLAEIKLGIATQPRISNIEDALTCMITQLKANKTQPQNSAPAAAKATYFQKSSPTAADIPDSSARLSDIVNQHIRGRSSLQDIKTEKLSPKHPFVSTKPVFDDDYYLTQEDNDMAYFIRRSYEDAKIVEFGDYDLTVRMLKPNVTGGFLVDQVMDAYASISTVHTDSTSVLRTYETRKLLGENGGIPRGCKSILLQQIANKLVNRDMVFIPMNVFGNHWVLIVLNFKRKEVQVLNSITNYRDEVQETTLVNSLQRCIQDSIDCGLITPTGPIDITKWKIQSYPDIPQQNNNHSCGAFVLKYMLTWDGEKITEDFAQEQIDIFCWKICSRLLFSEINKKNGFIQEGHIKGRILG